MLLIASALGATSTPALADPGAGSGTGSAEDAGDPYVTQIVPTCRVFVVPSVGEICGYQFLDDWKTVADADAELVLRRAEVKALAEQRDAERARAEALDDALDSREVLIGTLSKSLAEERTRYLDLDDKYQHARSTSWTTWLGWGVAAVAASALAGAILLN